MLLHKAKKVIQMLLFVKMKNQTTNKFICFTIVTPITVNVN